MDLIFEEIDNETKLTSVLYKRLQYFPHNLPFN